MITTLGSSHHHTEESKSSSSSSSLRVPLNSTVFIIVLLQCLACYKLGCDRSLYLHSQRGGVTASQQQRQHQHHYQVRSELPKWTTDDDDDQQRQEKDAALVVLQHKYEMLVHPTLLTHENPQIVAVVSASPQNLIREIEKHATVTTTFVVDMSSNNHNNHNHNHNHTTKALSSSSLCSAAGDGEATSMACGDDDDADADDAAEQEWWLGQVERLEQMRSDGHFFDVVLIDDDTT
jgi:hypothetical protein